MRLTATLALAAALAACGKKPAPVAPTPEAVGTELATFPLLLVPISSQTWLSMQAAEISGDSAHAKADQYPRPYDHGTVLVDGKETSLIVAFTSVWLAQSPIPLQTMSVQQYLRAFAADEGTNLAGVVAPRGTIFFTRGQLPAVSGAASAAGSRPEDLPYAIVRGSRR